MNDADATDRSSIRPEPFVHLHTHLLGTVVEVRVETDDEARAEAIDRRAVAEIERLQAVLSAVDETSELARWRRGELVEVSDDLAEVLGLALEWQRRSDGAFNPATGELSAQWRQAAIDGVVPDPDVLAAVVASIREPRYEMVDGRPVARGDCSHIELNAIAKGFIVDRAVAAALASDPVEGLCVNAGGDLLHRGVRSMRVGIEDPHRPYDNEPPLTSIRLRDGGLATSGRGRRGVRIAGRWYSHVLDAATGATVDQVASISVVAADAVTADVLTTVAGSLAPPDALRAVDALGGGAALVIDADGRRWANAAWEEIEISAG